MPTIRLTLCQEPPIRVESGERVDVALPAKSLALLAFLALEAGPHSREGLTTLLLGASPQEKAGAALRQGLSALPTTPPGHLPNVASTAELHPPVPPLVNWCLPPGARGP